MKVTHSLRMDLARCGCRPILGAVQGEANTRVLEVSLYDNGIAWEVPETAVVDVAYQKPDGTKGIYSKLPDGTIATSFSGNVLTAILAPQVLTCAGSIRAAFVFTKADQEVLATFPFTIKVEENPAAGAERSEDYFNPDDISDLRAEIAAHAARTDNPHGVTAEQVGARPNTWMPTAEQVGARPNTWMPTAEQVGARPNTWTPTAAEVGAAPAAIMELVKAFGINTGDILDVPNSNFNTLTGNSIYKGLKGSAQGFPDQMGEWAFVLTLHYDAASQFGVQFAWDMNGNTLCQRYKRNGTWNQWECHNPPMIPGVEYRTTMRRRGQPNYVKLIDFGSLPASGVASVYVGIAGSRICYINATAFSNTNGESQPLPMFQNGEPAAYYWVDNSGNLNVNAVKNVSDHYAVFEIYYDKD